MITLVTYISFVWAPVGALDLVKFEKLYPVMLSYIGAALATGVAFNVALLSMLNKRLKIHLYNKHSIQVYQRQ